MQALTGAVLVAAALLVVAGVPKITRPTPTTAALRSVGLTFVTRTQVRLLAVAEVAVGAAALVVGGVALAVAVALFYVAFSVFLVRALRPSSAGVSCGCTGRSDTPPTWAHLAMTSVLAVLATAAAVGGGHTGLLDLPWQDGLAEPALVSAYAAVGTWLGWVVLNELPELRLLRTTHQQ